MSSSEVWGVDGMDVLRLPPRNMFDGMSEDRRRSLGTSGGGGGGITSIASRVAPRAAGESGSLGRAPRGLVPWPAACEGGVDPGTSDVGEGAGPPVSKLTSHSRISEWGGGAGGAAWLPVVFVIATTAGPADVVAAEAAKGSSGGEAATRSSAGIAGVFGSRSVGGRDGGAVARLHCVAVLTRRRPNPRRAASA